MVAWTVLGSLLWLGAPPAAAGEDHHCVSVQDRDARSLCRAEATGKDHHCVSIQDADTRALCRAVVNQESHHCVSISDKDARSTCRMSGETATYMFDRAACVSTFAVSHSAQRAFCASEGPSSGPMPLQCGFQSVGVAKPLMGGS